MGRYLLEFDFLRRKAEARAMAGGAFPDAVAPVSRMQNAALPGNEKSPVTARVRGSLDSPSVAKQMRRRLGPCGGVARQDGLAARDLEVGAAEEGLFHEAWAARWEAKIARKDPPRRSRS